MATTVIATTLLPDWHLAREGNGREIGNFQSGSTRVNTAQGDCPLTTHYTRPLLTDLDKGVQVLSGCPSIVGTDVGGGRSGEEDEPRG